MPDTMHLVDPELRPMLAAWPKVALSDESLPGIRDPATALPFPPADPAGTTLERRSVPGPAGAPDILLHIYRPEAIEGPLPAIYHIHGGGYVMSHAAQYEFLHRPLVRELNCALISVDYRLAPEHVFPAAIEDCYAGLGWTFANADMLGLDVSRIGVMGESAGGGLAAALALLARDRGEYPLAFQHLTYPMIDDRTCISTDPHAHVGEFIWTASDNRYGWRALLGQEPGSAGVSPYAAAARAEDLAGLPPAFILTGALDLFLEENMDYARRLIRAGVPAELHVYPGGFHGFDMFPLASLSLAAQAAHTAGLTRALARGR